MFDRKIENRSLPREALVDRRTVRDALRRLRSRVMRAPRANASRLVVTSVDANFQAYVDDPTFEVA